MIRSTPTYHGRVSGSFKNALDWLILPGERDPPYLTNKPAGPAATAGGVHRLQAINSLDFIVRAPRGGGGPLVQPVAQAPQSFEPGGPRAAQGAGDQPPARGHQGDPAPRQFPPAR